MSIASLDLHYYPTYLILAVLLITVQLTMLLAQLWMMHFCISTSMIFLIYWSLYGLVFLL